MDFQVLSDVVVGILRKQSPLFDEAVRDRASERFPGQVCLAEVRKALATLAQKGFVKEGPHRLWELLPAAIALRSATITGGPADLVGGSSSVAGKLQEILQRRPDLRHEDGHPLYAYRLAQQELEELRHALREERDDALTYAAAPPNYSAAFCLFASHWFCRMFKGGTWSWDPIRDALDWRQPTQRFYPFVTKGLAWFKRELVRVTGQNEFLATLICEGGLPLGRLAQDNQNRLRIFFRSALKDVELLREPPAVAAERNGDLLPGAFRNGTTFVLAAELLKAVSDFRSTGIPEGSDPLQWLDQHHPAWRTRIPLALEGEVVTSFLKGLLTERRAGQSASPIVIETLLSSDYRRIERRCAFPPRISGEDLVGLFGTKDQAPGRVYLTAIAESGTRLPIGVACQDDDGSYRVERYPPRRFESIDDQLGRLCLIASFGSNELGRFEPPGGGPLSLDAPWVFEVDAAGAPVGLVRVGSVSLARPEALILCNPEAEVRPDAGSQVIEHSGLAVSGRRALSVSGLVRIRSADEEYVVAAGRDEKEPVAHFIRGDEARLPLSSRQYFRGMPHVLELESGGYPRSIPDRVEFRAHPHCSWAPWRPNAYGEIKLRILAEDRSVISYRNVLVLPKDFSLELVVGSGAGTVRLRSAHIERAALVADRSELAATCSSNNWEWAVTGRSSSELNLVLSFAGGASARLAVPAPITASQFVGAGAAALRRGESVPLNRLSSIVGQVASPNCSDAAYAIEAVSRSGVASFVGTLKSTSPTTAELCLLDVERLVDALLASSDELDATVRLKIIEVGGASRAADASIQVRRYDDAPELQKSSLGAVLKLPSDGPETVLEARSILAPELNVRQFDPVSPNIWSIPYENLGPGPWLLLGWSGELLRFRPTLLTVIGGNADPGSLAEAALEPEPAKRLVRIRQHLINASSKWDHPVIDELMQFAALAGRVPSATFDVLRALPEVPDTAAIALLRVSGTHRLRFYRSLEELPFIWSAIPLSIWLRAVDAWSVQLDELQRELKDQDQLFRAERARCQRELAEVADALDPFLDSVISLAARRSRHFERLERDALRDPSGIPKLRERVRELSRMLRQRHAAASGNMLAETWPPGPLDLGGALDPELRSLNIGIFAEHQRSVIEAPLRLARTNVQGTYPSKGQMLLLKRMRGFDPEWFDAAHATYLNLLISEGWNRDPKGFPHD